MDGYSGDQGSPASDGILLAATHPKKRAGRKKFRETRHPVYRGVRQRNSGKWVCELRHPNNSKPRLWLGTFPTAEMAARAHDVAAIALRGRAACLNFADSATRLPVPASTDPKEIQRAAAEAAEAFRPPAADQGSSAAAAAAAAPEVVEDGGVFVMDEEDAFRMPELLADMYKGMLLPPPAPAYDDLAYDDADSDVELPLWSYSI